MRVTRKNLAHMRLMSDLLAHAMLLTVSMRSLVFGLASRQSRLTMMPLLLCGSPNYRSSFVEYDTLVIVIVLDAQ